MDNVGHDEVDVRKFIIPKININAKTYYSLSSLSLKDMHEPPALKHLLNKEIEAVATDDAPSCEVPSRRRTIKPPAWQKDYYMF